MDPKHSAAVGLNQIGDVLLPSGLRIARTGLCLVLL